jgi:hypothetical protein
MPMKNPERALAKLVGEVHALYLSVQVLAKSHPYPVSALAALSEAEQRGLAALEPHPIDDAIIATFQETVEGIRQALLANPQCIPDSSS